MTVAEQPYESSTDGHFLRGSTSTMIAMLMGGPSSSPDLAAPESTSPQYGSVTAGHHRLLGDEDGETGETGETGGKDEPFTFMLAALIILIVVFFILCGYHILVRVVVLFPGCVD